MRYVFSRRYPSFARILIVESGERHVTEKLLPAMLHNHPDIEQVDLLTCHAGVPAGFDTARGRVFRVQDYRGASGRTRLYKELRARGASVAALLCTGSPVMEAWKWMTALRLPVKVLLVNENADYFGFDRSNARLIARFALNRAGLGHGHALPHFGQIAALPFTLAFLLGYAGLVHLRRRLRTSH